MMNSERISAKLINGSSVLDEIEELRQGFFDQITSQRDELIDECEVTAQERVALEASLPYEPIELSERDKIPYMHCDYQRIGIDGKAYEQDVKTQEAFKNTQNIGRNPVQPDLIKAFVILSVLTSVEIALNVVFFQSMHLSSGIVGAVFLSATLSVSNVFLSTLAGYLGRWRPYGLNANNPSEYADIRLKARAAFYGFVAIAGLMHLEVALVRAQESLIVTHSLSAYLAILNAPEAFFILVTGLCLSTVSYFKGYFSLDDPIPGYGATQRAINQSIERLIEHKDNGLEDIHDDFDDKVDPLIVQIEQNRQLTLSFNQKRKSCHEKKRQLSQAIEQAENQLKTEISKINHHLVSVGGKQAGLSSAQIEELTDFHYLLEDVAIPESYQAPDYLSEYRRKLDDARTKSLIAWNQIFEDILNPQQKESNYETK